uniref:(northern house mosquito) hypothetical protein n=1 Tax=Culex pipiens TaxID=7175 RepID=A0A8D8FWV0_CULPI
MRIRASGGSSVWIWRGSYTTRQRDWSGKPGMRAALLLAVLLAKLVAPGLLVVALISVELVIFSLAPLNRAVMFVVWLMVLFVVRSSRLRGLRLMASNGATRSFSRFLLRSCFDLVGVGWRRGGVCALGGEDSELDETLFRRVGRRRVSRLGGLL